jgi:hypothetical protein
MPNLNLNIYNIIILMGILQGLVFSFAILFTKKYYSKTNSFLAYTVLSLSFSDLQYWMIDSNLVKSFPVLGMLRIPCDFLMIPMFYFFVNHYLERKITPRHKLLLCLPFIIDFVFQIINTINTTIFHYRLINQNIVYNYIVIQELFSMFFSVALIILTIRIVNKYERENTNYSFKIVKARTKWLKQILFIGLAVCSFWTIQIYIMMNKGSSGMSIYYPIWICISFIIYWLSYVGLFQSSVLSQRKIIRERLLQKTDHINTVKVSTETAIKNNSSNQIEKAVPDDFEQTMTFLEEKRSIKEQYNDKIFTAFEKIILTSYANPNLSVEEVAMSLEISNNYLSQITSVHYRLKKVL